MDGHDDRVAVAVLDALDGQIVVVVRRRARRRRLDGRAVEPRRHRQLLARAKHDGLRRRPRVGGGEPELLASARSSGPPSATPRATAPTSPSASGGVAPDSILTPDRRALGLVPEPRRRPRLEVDLVDARLLVERRPGAVRDRWPGTYARTAAARTTRAQPSASSVGK